MTLFGYDVDKIEELSEIKKLKAELAGAREWVNDLHSGMYINCVYCGHRYGPNTEVAASMADVLKQHVEQCPKHPMSKLKAELAEARELMQDKLGPWLSAALVDPETCPEFLDAIYEMFDWLSKHEEGKSSMLFGYDGDAISESEEMGMLEQADDEADSKRLREKVMTPDERFTIKYWLEANMYGKEQLVRLYLITIMELRDALRTANTRMNRIYSREWAVIPKARVEETHKLIQSFRRQHYYCETDSWYSCPKAEDGCADESQGTECNCGADACNAKIDAWEAKEK